MFWLEVAVLACLAFICYQDFRYRAVYWISFPLLCLLLLWLKCWQAGTENAIWHPIFGQSFFSLQLLLLWVYFSVKHKRPVNLTAAHLGWGDVLFLAVIPFYLSPVNFIAFYMGSLVLVLLWVAATQMSSNKLWSLNLAGHSTTENLQIPLAGLQALMLGVIMILSLFLPQIKLYSDDWFYGF